MREEGIVESTKNDSLFERTLEMDETEKLAVGTFKIANQWLEHFSTPYNFINQWPINIVNTLRDREQLYNQFPNRFINQWPINQLP